MVSVVIAALWRRPVGAASFLAALIRQPVGETVLDHSAAETLEQSRVFVERLLQCSDELWAGLEAGSMTSAEAPACAFVEDCATLAYAAPPAAELCGGMTQAFLRGARDDASPASLAAVVAFAANSALAPGAGPSADALSAALGGGPAGEVAARLCAWRGPLRSDGLAPWSQLLAHPAGGGAPGSDRAPAPPPPSLLAEAARAQGLRDLLGGVPPELACALDGKLLMDPVRSPYGHVFERLVLERALAETGGSCPVTGQPLRLSHCQRAPELRLRAVQWIRASRARSG